MNTVCVVGLWHLGCVTAAGLAEAGYAVVGVDADQVRVAKLANEGVPPLQEPGLSELIRAENAAGRLRFSSDLTAVAEAEVVCISIDTPVSEDDVADVTPVMEVAHTIAPALRAGALVVLQSQVPVGTSDRILRALPRGVSLAVVPENLRLGVALERFRQPGFLVVGADTAAVHDRVAAFFAFTGAAVIRTDRPTAELSKHALNAFLATSISFSHEIAVLCERVGADAGAVVEAIQADPRIGGGLPLRPGLPFSGGTLARDLTTLCRLGETLGVPLGLLPSVQAVNAAQGDRIVGRLQELLRPLTGRRLAVLGLTYKAGTDTLRRSFPLELCERLRVAGADLVAYDPAVAAPALARHAPWLSLAPDPLAAAEGADALLVLTAWPAFRALDVRALAARMRRPILFDAVRVVDEENAAAAGFQLLRLGQRAPAAVTQPRRNA